MNDNKNENNKTFSTGSLILIRRIDLWIDEIRGDVSGDTSASIC